MIPLRRSLTIVSYQEQTTTDQTVTDTRDERLATHSVADTLVSEPSLARFADLTERTGLDRMLEDGEWITVFAPSDHALGNTELAGNDLHQFIRHHVSSGAKTIADLRRAGKLRMKDGTEAPVDVDGIDIRVGAAKIVRADIECTNGVIHVVDAVL
jgi:uncharacterized surface protein with fasciclin (FAS1) repeats